MSIGHNTDAAAPEARLWTQILNRYREPSRVRSIVELVITALPLVALWTAAAVIYSFGYWWASLLIAVPAAGFLVRLFMIQHDCGHGLFFPNRAVNDWVGRVIGVLTVTPYDFWRRTHAIHHATSGNLDPMALFYLRSRGLTKAMAETMLTFAFAAEVIERFADETIRHRVREVALGRLPGGDSLLELA